MMEAHTLRHQGWVWIPGTMTDTDIRSVYETIHKTNHVHLECEPPVSLVVSSPSDSSNQVTQCYSLSNPMENVALHAWVGGDPDTTIPLEVQRVWHRSLQPNETVEVLRGTHHPKVLLVVMQAINNARRRTKFPFQWDTRPGVYTASPVPVTMLRKYKQSVPTNDDDDVHPGGVLFCLGSLCLIHRKDGPPQEWWSCPPRTWVNASIPPTEYDSPAAAMPPHGKDSDARIMMGTWQQEQRRLVAAVTARLVRPADIHLFHTLGLVHRDICHQAATEDLHLDWVDTENKFLTIPDADDTGEDAHQLEHYAFRSHCHTLPPSCNDDTPTSVVVVADVKPPLPVCPRSWLLHGAVGAIGTRSVIQGFTRVADLSLPYGPPVVVMEPTGLKTRIKLPPAFCSLGCSCITIRHTPNEERHVLVVCGAGGMHFVDGMSAMEVMRQHILPRLSFLRFLLWDPRTAPPTDTIRLVFTGGAEVGTLQTCLCVCLIALFPMASIDEVVSISVVIGLQVLRDNRTFPLSAITMCLDWQAECRRAFWMPYRPPDQPLETVHRLFASMDVPSESVDHHHHHPRPRCHRASPKPDPSMDVVINPDYASARQYITVNLCRAPRPRATAPPHSSNNKPRAVQSAARILPRAIRHFRAALNRTARFESRVIKGMACQGVTTP